MLGLLLSGSLVEDDLDTRERTGNSSPQVSVLLLCVEDTRKREEPTVNN